MGKVEINNGGDKDMGKGEDTDGDDWWIIVHK
jgi:hypothetical protein